MGLWGSNIGPIISLSIQHVEPWSNFPEGPDNLPALSGFLQQGEQAGGHKEKNNTKTKKSVGELVFI